MVRAVCRVLGDRPVIEAASGEEPGEVGGVVEEVHELEAMIRERAVNGVRNTGSVRARTSRRKRL